MNNDNHQEEETKHKLTDQSSHSDPKDSSNPYISDPIKTIKEIGIRAYKNIDKYAAVAGIQIAFGIIVSLVAVITVVLLGLLLFGTADSLNGTSWGIFTMLIAFGVFVFFVAILSYPMAWFGLVNLRLANVVAKNKKPEFKQLFSNDTQMIFKLIGLGLVMGFMTLFGLLLLVIPGIIVAIFLAYAPFILAEEDCSIFEAISKSFRLVKESFVDYLGIFAVLGIFNVLMSIIANVPFVGIFFSLLSFPISLIVSAVAPTITAYRYISIDQALSAGETRKGKSSSLNLVLVAVYGGLILVSVALAALLIFLSYVGEF